jgi:hypothetical protein
MSSGTLQGRKSRDIYRRFYARQETKQTSIDGSACNWFRLVSNTKQPVQKASVLSLNTQVLWQSYSMHSIYIIKQ